MSEQYQHQTQDSEGPSFLQRMIGDRAYNTATNFYQASLRLLTGALTVGLGATQAVAAEVPYHCGPTADNNLEFTIEGSTLTETNNQTEACIDETPANLSSLVIQGGDGDGAVAIDMLTNGYKVQDDDGDHVPPAYCVALTEAILRAGLTGDGDKGELTIHIHDSEDRYEGDTVYYTLSTDDADITIDAPTGFGATLSTPTYDADSETYTIILSLEEGREGEGYKLTLDGINKELPAVNPASPVTATYTTQDLEAGANSIDVSSYDFDPVQTLRFTVCNETTADCEMEKTGIPNGGLLLSEDWYTDDSSDADDFEDSGDEGDGAVTTLGSGRDTTTSDGDGSLEDAITAADWESRMAQAIGAVAFEIRTRYKGTTGIVGRTEATGEREVDIYSGTNLDAKKYVAALNQYAKATWGSPLIDNNTTVSMTFDALETDSVQATREGVVTTMNTGTHTSASIEHDKAYLHNENGRSPVARIMFNGDLDVGDYNSHSTPTGTRTATTGNESAAVQDYSFSLTFTTTIDGEGAKAETQAMNLGVYPVEGHTPKQVALTALAIGGGVGTAVGIIAAVDQTNKRKAAEDRADELQNLIDNMPEGEGPPVYTPSGSADNESHTDNTE